MSAMPRRVRAVTLCDRHRSGGSDLLRQLPLSIPRYSLSVAKSDPPPISQPASSNRRAPLSPDANRQAQAGTRSTRQAGAPAPPQVLTQQDWIPIQQNITQAAGLREEVERARRRVQQSHESVETYLQTAIDTMNLVQAYITHAQGTDMTRSAAVLTTLSGYINLTIRI